jgi:hypothetical protein
MLLNLTRAALGVITDRNQASKVRGNLGALLLEAGRAEEAVAQFDHSLSLVRTLTLLDPGTDPNPA